MSALLSPLSLPFSYTLKQEQKSVSRKILKEKEKFSRERFRVSDILKKAYHVCQEAQQIRLWLMVLLKRKQTDIKVFKN